MNDSTVVELFNILDQGTEIMQTEYDDPYLDRLAIAIETLFFSESVQNERVIERLGEYIQQVHTLEFSHEHVRKAIQLAILKGMKHTTQHQHVMTPEAVALFIGYLTNKCIGDQKEVRLFDPASGTANLLLTVMDQLDRQVYAYGSEIDPTLIKLALLQANIQEKHVEFFHQDSLRPLLLDPVDVVVADLPVGYYPDDEEASRYALKSSKGHSYAHHLFMEQSLTYTKEGGYLFFVIPENLFESDQSQELHAFLQEKAHVIGVIQLAASTFASDAHKKSIFILRKRGAGTEDIKQPLLAVLPSFSDTKGMENILVKMNEWFEEQKERLK